MCSLFSPMFEFAEDAAAVATARAVMTELMAEANLERGDISTTEIADIWNGERPVSAGDEPGPGTELDAVQAAGQGGLGERLERPISRRQLLRASLLQEDAQS